MRRCCNVIFSDWRINMQPSPGVITLVSASPPPAVAAGHYGAFLGDAPRLPVVFIAAVPTILPSLVTPPTLLLVTCGTMQLSPGGVTRTPQLSPRPFLAAAAFFFA